MQVVSAIGKVLFIFFLGAWLLAPFTLQSFYPFNLWFLFYDIFCLIWFIGDWFVPRSAKYRSLLYSMQTGRNKLFYVVLILSVIINLMYWPTTVAMLSRGYIRID